MQYKYVIETIRNGNVVGASTDFVELKKRPFIGESVKVEQEWHKIHSIEHHIYGLLLVLEPKRIS